MILTWIIVLVMEFMVAVVYFTITESVHNLLDSFVTHGAPAGLIDWIYASYHLAFMLLAGGLILYAILKSVQKEYDSYQG